MNSSPSPEEKGKFFDELAALNDDASDDDSLGPEEEALRLKSQAFFNVSRTRARPKSSSAADRNRQGINIASPLLPSHPPTSQTDIRSISFAPGTLRSQSTRLQPRPNPSLLQRSATAPPLSSPRSKNPSSISADYSLETMAPTIKRKRSQPLASPKNKQQKQLPESEKVFRGLRFFYIPNNDTNPVRKARIQLARDHGAEWVRPADRSLTPAAAGATHVIVDSKLTFEAIEKFVNLASAGAPAPTSSPITSPSSPVFVNENYPLECISFHKLLNPRQAKYRIKDFPESTSIPPEAPREPQPSELTSAVVVESDRSLQVKQARGTRSSVALAETPPRGDGDESSGGREMTMPQEVDRTDLVPDLCTSPITMPDDGEDLGSARDSALALSCPGSPPGPKPNGPKDALSDLIEFVQQYKDLPVDDSDDDNQSERHSENAASETDSDDGPADERLPSQQVSESVPPTARKLAFEEHFACSRGGTKDSKASADAANPNARTIEVLQAMCAFHERTGDQWRTRAYRRAITTLRQQTGCRITTAREAARLPAIGPRISRKIEEIVATDTLRQLQYARSDPFSAVLSLFLGIYDVGLSTAKRWVARGLRSLEDLTAAARHGALDLTPNQRMGIERYVDLNTRIPRAEVVALGAFVRREAAAVDPAVELVIGGSFRRGADSSGDIDFIVTRKGTTSAAELVPFLERLVEVLTEKRFLVYTVAALHAHRPGKSGPGSKWHGCCVLPRREWEEHKLGGGEKPGGGGGGGGGGSGNMIDKQQEEEEEGYRPIWRRIDFLLVPEAEYGAALLYFTGNDLFNRSMRLLAGRKRMRLNQHGLYRNVMRGRGGVKVTEGELVEGRDERSIFELLGVRWREPHERWC